MSLLPSPELDLPSEPARPPALLLTAVTVPVLRQLRMTMPLAWPTMPPAYMWLRVLSSESWRVVTLPVFMQLSTVPAQLPTMPPTFW